MAVFLAGAALAAPPSISFIERFSTNQVLIHFDLDANLKCTLQCTSSLPTPTNGLASATWSNFWVAPVLPFFEHYIIPDTATNRQRFYRLQVSR